MRGKTTGGIYPFGARRLMRRYHGFVGACPELVEGLLATTGYAKVSCSGQNAGVREWNEFQ